MALPAAGRAGGGRVQAGCMVCIPVAGPWVAIPSRRARTAVAASWQLECPEGVVAGVDARVSETGGRRSSFRGMLGSPVNPGITTTTSVVFTGTYTGTARQADELPALHRLHSDLRRRQRRRPHSSPATSSRGEPITTRSGRCARQGTLARATLGCAAGERLLCGVEHASGLPHDGRADGGRARRGPRRPRRPWRQDPRQRDEAGLGRQASARRSKCSRSVRGELGGGLSLAGDAGDAPAGAPRPRRLPDRRAPALALRDPLHEHRRPRERCGALGAWRRYLPPRCACSP